MTKRGTVLPGGACPHVLTIWVSDQTKRGSRTTYRPRYLRCTVGHAPDETVITHHSAGRSWR